MGDKLFDSLERFHGDRPWGRVLDAGTGEHSLRWLTGLAPEQIVAVTGAPSRARQMTVRPADEVVLGNWTDPTLLHGERFDVVLADYLLGAIDGFAPYFQSKLFSRLHPHVGGALYFVGLEPFGEATTVAQKTILEIARLRDACILLAGHKCYREYPRSWVLDRMQESGFEVLDSWEMPIVYRARFVNGQLDVCERKLAYFRDFALRESMKGVIDELRTRALGLVEAEDGIRFGADYVVIARPAG
ncbi:MAG: class I SAM-dependent methyltransferase [Proteobacteria bacterium]|nr:class I SAM-dependent methyltransferase [Pseudomonadota bacterium]MCP4921434.1 class I SAM-dependent methyltransferase [Pseudomonadota bacterium]